MKNCNFICDKQCMYRKNVVHTCISTLPIIRFTTKQLIEAIVGPIIL